MQIFEKNAVAFLSFLVVCCITRPAAAAALDASDYVLPSSWYTLPENETTDTDRVEGKTLYRLDEGAKSHHRHRIEDAWDRLVDDTADVDPLDELFEATSEGMDIFATQDGPAKINWRLHQLRLNLGISLKGVIGVVFGKGAISSEIFWTRRYDTPSGNAGYRSENSASVGRTSELAGGNSGDDSAPTLALDALCDAKAFSLALDPVVASVMATGKVKDESALRTNLAAAAVQVNSIFDEIESIAQSTWNLSKLRLDMSVTVTGKVYVFTSVGGAIRVRIDWTPAKDKNACVLAGSRDTNVTKDMQHNFNHLVRGLTSVFSVLPETQDVDGTPLRLETVAVGVGFDASGRAGVVRAQGVVIGELWFKRAKKDAYALSPGAYSGAYSDAYSGYGGAYGGGYPPPPLAPLTVPLIEVEPSEEHLSYASASGISHQLIWDERLEARVAHYDVPVEAMRRGLDKALSLNRFIASKAIRHEGRRWYVSEVRPVFQLSVGGDVAFATLAGIGQIIMCFVR